MKELISVIRTLLEGLDIRRRWVAIAGMIVSGLVLMYALELWTGWNYYRNLEKKIDLLSKLNSLYLDGVAANPELGSIYSQAVGDLAARSTAPARLPAIGFRGSVAFWKAVSGASFWILFAFLGLFGTFGKENRGIAAVSLLIVGAAFAYVGSIIPTVWNPWVNYIAFPLLQIAVLVGLSTRAQKRKQSPQVPTIPGAA